MIVVSWYCCYILFNALIIHSLFNINEIKKHFCPFLTPSFFGSLHIWYDKNLKEIQSLREYFLAMVLDSSLALKQGT